MKPSTKSKICQEHALRIGNSLIQAEYPVLPTVNSHRILQLALSAVCKNLHNNKDDDEALKGALKVKIKTKTLQNLFPSFKKAGGSVHKRIDVATSIILQNNFIKTQKDAGNFKKTAFIKDIEYINFDEVVIEFMEDTRELFNPDSFFTRYVINNTAKLFTYQQIRIYELCYQYIVTKHKYRIINIATYKQFLGIKKNKATSHLISELKASIKQINKKTNLEIELETTKTSRKITHIKFKFYRTDLHPLDAINQQPNDLKAQLLGLGFKEEKLKSLLKISANVLTQAIRATQKAKIKGFKKSMEACFFYQIGIISDENNNITPLEIVGMFKESLGVKKYDLWQEFYAQLPQDTQAAYSENNRERNKILKEAVDKDFDSKYNRWIYETKIK